MLSDRLVERQADLTESSRDESEPLGSRVQGQQRDWDMLLAPLAGAGSTLGLEPYGFWPITILAVTWLLYATLATGSPWGAWKRGWLFGAGHFAVGLSWLPTAFLYQDSIPRALSWPALSLLAAYLAIYPASSLAVARSLGGRNPLVGVLAAASCWVIAEWLRGTLLTGFPWNPLAIIWVDVPFVAQTAGWIGAIGLSGLTVLLAGSLILAATRRYRQAAAVLVLASLPVIAASAIAPAETATLGNVRATVVQPNIPQREKWRPDLARRNLNTHMALSGPPGTPAMPRLLFWPEAAVPFQLETDPNLRRRLATLLGPRDLLLTGGTASAVNADGSVSPVNSIFVLNSSGQILFRYDKAHLVPFGEYLPMSSLLSHLGLEIFAPGSMGFAAGPGPTTLMLPGLPAVGPAICYEIVFPGQVTDPGKRPSFLFNPSNDGWFGRTGPPQHLAHARMRSIEEGLPTVRSTTNGISAVIAPDGSMLASLPDRRSGRIEALLPRPHAPTIFSKFGNTLAIAFGATIIIVLIGYRSSARWQAAEANGRK